MTDDQNPRSSDAHSDPTPPTAPDGADLPTNPPPPPAGLGSTVGPPPGYRPQPYPHQPYPQQAPTGYQAYGQSGFGSIPQSNGKATGSMVVGIVGLASIFFCYGVLGIVLGPVAYFMGRSAEKDMATSPEAWSNKGMAKAGWIMGLIQIVLAILVIVLIGAFLIWFATADDADF